MKLDFSSDINKDNQDILNYAQTDKFMIKVLWWSAVIISLYAFAVFYFKPSELYPSPYSWHLISLREAFAVSAIGILTALVMTVLRGRLSSHYMYRITMAQATMVFAYLLVFVTGGAIEAHFSFFIMLGLLVMYADWRLGWLGVLAVGFHHGSLNFLNPAWVFAYGRNDIGITAHVILVVIMAIFTTRICESMRISTEALKKTNQELNMKSTELERLGHNLEKEVGRRTDELHGKIKDLERFQSVAIGRELAMVELKKKMKDSKKLDKADKGR